MAGILAVDDDRAVLRLIEKAFDDSDVRVITASRAEQAVELVRQHSPEVVMLDVMLPETSGLEVAQRIRAIDSKLPVIFVTVVSESDTAIEAMKLGAYDYLLKPLDMGQVRELVLRARESRRMMEVPVALPEGDAPSDEGDVLVGRSPQIVEVYKAIGRVAAQDVPVLICGESGTGKELIARAIYQHSNRRDGPFLAVNCAALTETLLESELFGHEKGAFTGADRRRIGKFEQCSGGTIFLDEIADMSPVVQGKVLRLLQQQQFERVGGNETIETDVRILSATNRDLDTMVAAGEFRLDLYHRLNGFRVDLAPLRERGDDVELLLEHFLARYSKELDKPVEGISPEALAVLRRYSWPGNVRELQSVLKQAMLQATGPVLVPDSLPREVVGGAGPSGIAGHGEPETDLARFLNTREREGSKQLYAESLEFMERYLITRVLRASEGNQSQAAGRLGITRGSLRNKMRALGISVEQIVNSAEAGDSNGSGAIG